MKFSYTAKNITDTPKEFVRVELTEEAEVLLKENTNSSRTLQIGVGKRALITRRKFFLLIRKVIQTAKQHNVRKIAVQFEKFPIPQLKASSEEDIVSLIAQNLELANFEFTAFKTKPKTGWNEVTDVLFCGKTDPKIQNAVTKGQTIAAEVNKCRILANTPGGDMTPALLARAAQDAAQGTSIKISVLNKKEIEGEKMGAILGVAKGSSEEPKFIIMEYWGGGDQAKDKPIVLVGKGVTFDTGGLNLKPTEGIYEMHMDMSGGAAVIHAIVLAAKLKLKKNVIALIPAVENMPSGSSYRPGDVLRSMSGKTIEVLNTDAEGRIILADGLTYAKRYNPKLVIDVATLTSAILATLGQHAHGIMSKNEKLVEKIRELGEKSGEHVWPLPLWDEYEQYVVGTFGDVANMNVGTNIRFAGSITAGMFLYQFTKDYSKETAWVHIDMASRMTSAPGDNLAKGATGEPVRLLLKILEEL